MKKRLLVILLCLLFLTHFGSVFAGNGLQSETSDDTNQSSISDILSAIQSLLSPDEKETESSDQSPAVIPLSNFHVGDTITLGHYEQDGNRANGREVIEWRILKLDGGRALVISQYGLANKPYYYLQEGKTYDDTWDKSTLRSWLNNEFLNDAFSADEQKLIPTVMINTKNPFRAVEPNKSTQDRIFLLSEAEADDYFSSDEDRKTRPTAYVEDIYGSSSSWLLRSGSQNDYAGYSGVDGNGRIQTAYFYGFLGELIRPAFWIDLTGYSGPSDENIPVETAPVDDAVGKLLLLGKYEQDNNKANGPEPIIWQVLTVEDSRALIICRYSLEFMEFSKDLFTDDTWETSPVRQWLNDNFYNSAFSSQNTALNKSEKSRIIQVTNENPDNPDYGTDCGNPTQDYVFLLNLDEVLKYMPTRFDRMAGATKYADAVCNAFFSYLPNSCVLDWKLRTLGLSHVSSKVQNQNGFILMYAGNGGDMPGGIRPALWLDIEGLELYDELPEYEQAVLDDGVMVDMCPMKSYLKPGDHAEVAINAGLKIRKEPAGAETGIQAFSGKDVKILNGPVCESGTVWFEIDFLGHRGWSMEGKDGTYYLKKTSGSTAAAAAPVESPASQQSGSSQNSGGPAYPTLRPGDTVDIINIASLQMFMTPNRNPMEGVVAFPGKTAKITDGPKLENNVYWYEIDFLGYHGWVMGMTTGGTYYLEKVN